MKKLQMLSTVLCGSFVLGLSSLTVAQGQTPTREPIEGNVHQEMQAEGCWIEIYDEENFMFEGRGLGAPEAPPFENQILGPLTIMELDSPRAVEVLGRDWNDDIESVRVGPNARVCFYEEESLQSESLCLEPGSEVANLDRFDLDDDIESMVIQCQ